MTTAPADDAAAVPLPDEPIVVHLRPGCGFCSGLVRGLERHGVEFARVDIWQDEDAAAFVRSVADGNELSYPDVIRRNIDALRYLFPSSPPEAASGLPASNQDPS